MVLSPRTLLVPSLLAVLLAACEADLIGPDPVGPDPLPTVPAEPADIIRIVTFGDSNTDFGYSGTSSTVRVSSYVSGTAGTRLTFHQANSSYQLAGKIEIRWSGPDSIVAVNHGIGGTSSGAGRHPLGAPNALTAVIGVTRFQAEVLGTGYLWNGGEGGASFPAGAIDRTKAFKPDSTDFAYISIGTNDPSSGISTAQTLSNLQGMVNAWTGAGHSPRHLIVTTLAPASGKNTIPAINAGIRSLASSSGVHVVDLAAHTSGDDGLTWLTADLHVGDALQYSEPVRDWLAGEVVAHMSAVLYATAG